MSVVIKVQNTGKLHGQFSLNASDSIYILQTKIYEKFHIPQEHQILLYRGKQLTGNTIEQYGIQSYETVNFVEQYDGGGPDISRLRAEMREMSVSPPAMCSAGPKGEDLSQWQAMICGPPDSPYAGGFFHLDISFPTNYPSERPKVTFKTRIYHPNISTSGGVCVKSLGSWNSETTIAQVLLSIYGMMCSPNPESPLRSDVAKVFKNDRSQFNSNARAETRAYASRV